MAWFKKSATGAESVSAKPQEEVRLSLILSPGAVKLELEGTDKEEVFEEMVDLLVQSGGVRDREGALTALRTREAMAPTGIGNGIALPHGKHPTIETLVAALGVSRNGVDFDCPDGKPAHVIFVLLARVDNPGPHIQALAEIAQLVQSPSFLGKVMELKTPQEVLQLIRSEE